QGLAHRRRNFGPHRESEGRRAGELRRPAGRRQGRRPARHGAGRRYRAGQAAECAGIGEEVGRGTGMTRLLAMGVAAVRLETPGKSWKVVIAQTESMERSGIEDAVLSG